MLEVMLCGAQDLSTISGQFAEVVLEFGGDPWQYLAGRVLHVNSMNASWAANSRATVQKADLCVFVIVQRYGDITWSVELKEALGSGKPFLIFCLRETYQKYLTLSRSIASPDAISDPGDRALIAAIRELEYDHQLTIVPYEHGYFKDELRRHMATLFSESLEVMAMRNQRLGLIGALDGGKRLTSMDRQLLSSLATDEAEDKNIRKRALTALAEDGGLDEDDLQMVLDSREEGVQRLSVELLPRLWPERPVSEELLNRCVQIANSSDDVGVTRRLIPVLFAMDVAGALHAMDSLNLSEVGARRRLAAAIEEYESAIVEDDLRFQAASLAGRCLAQTTEAGWLQKCKDLIERLSTENGN
jgi:hypothetical protein